MIKVYLDWGVMSEMKRDSQSELKKILLNNERFFIPYSSSHIADILPSYKDTEQQKSFIKSDLDFISDLTKNICLSTSKEGVVMNYYSPHDYFDSQLESKNTFLDLSMDGLMKAVDEDEFAQGIMKTVFDSIKSTSLGKEFEKAFENPESAELMNSIFPNLKENPTMEGFFESFNQMNFKLMESDGYNDLRKGVQKGLGINRDKIFNSADPYKLIDDAYKTLGSNPLQYVPESRLSPKWYNDINNEFFLLDSHGYQEDKVSVKKGRKQTFRNSTEDSNHAAYASMCNIYIVRDDKSYKKSKKVYEKLGIYTRVLKPDEFVNYYKNFLEVDEGVSILRMPYVAVENGEYSNQDLNGKEHRVYFTPYLLFDFFNVILIPHINEEDEEFSMTFIQNIPNNGKTYLMEFHHVYNLLSGCVGEDIEKLGQIKKEELNDAGWIGRNWKAGLINIRLDCFEGNLQLTYRSKR